MLRDWSRNTSFHAFHDRLTSSGASNSFAIHAEYKFSVSRFQLLRSGQTLSADDPPAPAGLGAATAMSRVMVPQPPGALLPVSVMCQVPAAGVATSAYQKYGGPPLRSPDFAATLPLGATNDSAPSIGFSETNSTRSGTPCHGAIGAGSTATPAACSQALDAAWDWARASATESSKPDSAPAIS